jgi:hypothetical protein
MHPRTRTLDAQVTIAGALRAVEDARSSVRALAPLAVTFGIDQLLRPGIDADELMRNPSLEQVAAVL